MSLNVDGLLCRGFWGAMIWIASAAIFWIGDFLHLGPTCSKADLLVGKFQHPRDDGVLMSI